MLGMKIESGDQQLCQSGTSISLYLDTTNVISFGLSKVGEEVR